MGLYKQVCMLGCLSLALITLVSFSTADTGRLSRRAAHFQKGVALGVYAAGNTLRAYRPDLVEIRALGADSISLPVYWFQEDVRAAEIHPYRGSGFDQARYDAQVRSVINEAHELGLRVFLVPIVQLEKIGPGQWRGTLRPADWERWFASYETFILHYARLAASEGVELFSMGSELASTEGFRREWTNLIQRVRAVYRGKLTYSANWDHYRGVSFWDELDLLGVSGYYTLSREMPTTYPELRRQWQAIRAELLHWQKKEGKPLVFTEIGYPSQASAAQSPWDYTAKGYPDAPLQRLCYQAFIQAWKGTPELAGVYLWIWEPGSGPQDTGYAWRGKPAQQEIEAWYREL